MHSDVRFKMKDFQRDWANLSLRTEEIAARLKVPRGTVSYIAKRLDLPSRRHVRRLAIPRAKISLFVEMWRAGVWVTEMAAHFDVHLKTISNTAVRLGEEKRQRGRAQKGISMADFWVLQLRDELVRAAAAEQASIISADLADTVGTYVVGRAIVKAVL